MEGLIHLDLVDLVLALGLMAVAVGLSAWENLGLELNLVIATVRTILQLLVLGYVLDFILAVNNIWAFLAILTVLLTITTIVTRNRISPKLPYLLPLVWVCLFISTGVTVMYTNFLIFPADKWYELRYLVPLTGIVLGNAMNVAAIAGEHLVGMMSAQVTEIETHLSLGATPEQAVRQYRRVAIRAAIIPTINQMMLVGMVAIPGFTSGQLVGGIKPSDAVAYEILMIFMVAMSNMLTTILLTRGLYRQFFNSVAQLVN